MILPVLSVADVKASLKFYTEKLGFQQTMALDGPDGVVAFASVSLGQATFMLSRAETENVGQGVVFMVYLPEDADIDEVYKDVQSKGVALEGEIKTEYWGDRTFSLKDPDGYFVSICKTVQETDMKHVEKVMRGEVEA
jgi:PhnB protein